MDRAPRLKPEQTAASVPAHGNDRTPGSASHRPIGIAPWVIGVVILADLDFLAHVDTAPWSFKLGFTKTIQGPHPIPCPVPLQPILGYRRLSSLSASSITQSPSS
jgi:hypothetical protein